MQHFLEGHAYREQIAFEGDFKLRLRGPDAQYQLSLMTGTLLDQATGLELIVSESLLQKTTVYLPFRGDYLLAQILRILALVPGLERSKLKSKQ